MNPIIEVKNISKKYNITHQQGGYVALRDVLTNVAKRPFAFLKHKAKQAVGKAGKEEFWALKDINFTVEKGEAIGIIGANGAGKSTLLKILTGITPPTTGEIRMQGSVASLLEVGTGFHPELTGRENIFLNGAILGMAKKEISDKFNDIVKFSGVEKFIDTPVKRYSSGMYVRLAFSVAAHMEPDILLVDEVLAVGDAEFQKKCLGKMDEVTKQAGRTILFVSHNMSAVQRLCPKTILLEKGKIKKFGKTEEVIEVYLHTTRSNAIVEYKKPQNTDKVAFIQKIKILNKEKVPSTQIPINENLFIEIEYQINKDIENALLSVVFNFEGNMLLVSSPSDTNGELINFNAGNYITTVEIPKFLFNVGHLTCDISITKQKPCIEFLDRKQDVSFEILNVKNPRANIFGGKNFGKISSILNYETKIL
ncbi:MAG: ABC transporter ATP-binding protein [bacterium]|nr:ABC transporter ATP-binding protein [bacterium]